MSIKMEIGAAIATALIGMGVVHQTQPLAPQAPVERTAVFSANDYAAFDRDFLAKDASCAVGLERRKMCFTASPLQTRVIEGEPIPTDMPLLAAEFPILVALPIKDESQKLLRYGTVLALINEDTRMVEDLLYIDAENYADASRSGQRTLADSNDQRTSG